MTPLLTRQYFPVPDVTVFSPFHDYDPNRLRFSLGPSSLDPEESHLYLCNWSVPRSCSERSWDGVRRDLDVRVDQTSLSRPRESQIKRLFPWFTQFSVTVVTSVPIGHGSEEPSV